MAQMEINKDLVIEGTSTDLGTLEEKMMPTVLYSATDSVKGDAVPVTLNDDWSNYTFIEIWYNKYDPNASDVSKRKAEPSNYGLSYTKIYTAVPYINRDEGWDGHYWGSYYNIVLQLTGTRTLTDKGTDRAWEFGGNNGNVTQFWTYHMSASIVKVIGWKY